MSCLFFTKVIRKMANIFADVSFMFIQKPILLMDKSNKFELEGKLRNCRIKVTGEGNSIRIEKDCILNRVFIDISGRNNSLILHQGVTMKEGGRIRIEDYKNSIEIHEGATLINVFLSSADKETKMTIGKNCLFSSDVIIRTSDSHSILDESGNRINYGKDVSIGNHTWICYGVRVMKGTNIGSDCVVGSNTMITGISTGDNVLVVGNPAKVVKSGINWTIKRILDK